MYLKIIIPLFLSILMYSFIHNYISTLREIEEIKKTRDVDLFEQYVKDKNLTIERISDENISIEYITNHNSITL